MHERTAPAGVRTACTYSTDLRTYIEYENHQYRCTYAPFAPPAVPSDTCMYQTVRTG